VFAEVPPSGIGGAARGGHRSDRHPVHRDRGLDRGSRPSRSPLPGRVPPSATRTGGPRSSRRPGRLAVAQRPDRLGAPAAALDEAQGALRVAPLRQFHPLELRRQCMRCVALGVRRLRWGYELRRGVGRRLRSSLRDRDTSTRRDAGPRRSCPCWSAVGLRARHKSLQRVSHGREQGRRSVDRLNHHSCPVSPWFTVLLCHTVRIAPHLPFGDWWGFFV
jgi:hypothetical protein